jgi:CRP/FNR family transcriptional regulator, cyclic AMP receptor protein
MTLRDGRHCAENVSRILNDWASRSLVTRIAGYYCLENKAAIEHEAEL